MEEGEELRAELEKKKRKNVIDALVAEEGRRAKEASSSPRTLIFHKFHSPLLPIPPFPPSSSTSS